MTWQDWCEGNYIEPVDELELEPAGFHEDKKRWNFLNLEYLREMHEFELDALINFYQDEYDE